MVRYNKEDGVWRTIKGRHIFIRNGQSISDAIKELREKKKVQKNNKAEEDEDFVVKGTPKPVSPEEELARIREYDPEYNDDDFENKGPGWGVKDYPTSGVFKTKKDDYKTLSNNFVVDNKINTGSDDYTKSLNKYMTEHGELGGKQGGFLVYNSDENDFYKAKLEHDKEYVKLTSQGKLTDETDIARRIRQGKMVKDDSIWDDNQTYHIGDEKNGYYVQFQDTSTHQHEDINKYPRVSPKVKSNTWARVWKDGQIVYNNYAGYNDTREGKYSARANVAKFLEGEKSYSSLVQSYMKAGFTKAQAEAFAKYQLRRRK